MAKPKDRQLLGDYEELLPVKLKDAELLERAKKIGQVNAELNSHRAEFDAVKRQMREKEAELEELQQKLAHTLFTGSEPRAVKVEAWANFVADRFEEIRTDNGEVLNTRRLEVQERQGTFDPDAWGEQLSLRLKREREDVAKKRAGDEDEDEPS